MKKKSFKSKRQTYGKGKIHKKQVGKILISSAVASTLVFQPFVPIIQNGQLVGFTENSASAAELADVRIFGAADVSATITDPSASEPYNLNMSVTGTGVDIDLVNPEPVAVFYAPDLAGDLTEATAQVSVNTLPIQAADIPALGTTLDSVISTVDTAVGGLLSGLDGLLGFLLPDEVLTIEGIEELNTALDALNNLDTAVFNVTDYNTTVIPTIDNGTGTITVDFSDGLGNHLDSSVNDVVVPLLEDVTTALDNLNISLLDGALGLDTVVNSLVDTVVEVTGSVNGLVDDLLNGTTSLTSELVAAQVLGNTTVTVNALVNKNTSAIGQIPVSGNIINRSVIDAQLLSDLNDSATTVNIPETADTTAPAVSPIIDTTVIEKTPIEDIDVVTDDETSIIATSGLPNGLAYNEAETAIVGTPVIADWGEDEEERVVEVTVTATDEANNAGTETFNLTILRDTDGDGSPDIEDEDDDNDGATDDEENEAGTDPKDENDLPASEIAPIEGLSSIEDQVIFENQPIREIVVTTDNPDAVISVEESQLPTGVSFNEEANTIAGTPETIDWTNGEEERPYDVAVVVENPDGSSTRESFTFTIQRDTDGDGIPDVSDDDDDNDEFTDEEEEEAGTDPKDDQNFPDVVAPVITPVEDSTLLEGAEIDSISIETSEPSEVEVSGLPSGLEYDSETEAIIGAPVIRGWGETEEEREFSVTATATDEAGNVGTEDFVLTIERDTDRDGDPDLTDPDDDNDGIPDEEEENEGTNPKDDFIAPEAPVVEELTSEDTEVVGTAEPGSEITITLPNEETVTGTTNEDGEFAVELPAEPDLTGGEVIEIVATDEAGNASEQTSVTVTDRTAPLILDIDNQTVVEGSAIEDIEVVVENSGEQQPALEAQASTFALIRPLAAPLSNVYPNGLPEGVSFDNGTNMISGTPVVSDWGETEEERDFEVTVVASDEAGNEATETFLITVQRDTDGDTNPDVTDTDDDNDGATDEEELEAGTDPKDETDTPPLSDTEAPVITPISDVEATENTAIDDIVIEVNEPSEVLVTYLPAGLTFHEDTNTISGTPTINNWGETEEERSFETVITALDAAGNEGTETFLFTVLRDTDGDGTPNVEDTDDDNDGATDEEELEAGTNPKDETDTPAPDTEAPVITPIPDISAEENQPMEDVVVEVNEPSDVIVEGLPSGITYDPETGVISGTPVVENWTADETERPFDVTITAEDEAGNVSTVNVTIVISRDMDGTAGVSDSDNNTDGSANDENNNSGDSQDSGTSDANGQETLPQTGESQNVWKVLSGSAMAAVGAFMLAWNKKKKEFIKKK